MSKRVKTPDRPALPSAECAVAVLENEIRRRFSEFEGSDELPSEAARDLCIWLLTHERIVEALEEVRRLAR